MKSQLNTLGAAVLAGLVLAGAAMAQAPGGPEVRADRVAPAAADDVAAADGL